MTSPKKPLPAKLLIGVLSSSLELLELLKNKLADNFGPIDLESRVMKFNRTDYYESQMGKHLKRKFFSFKELVEQESLAQTKLAANELEKLFAGKLPVERPVNIDPGIMLPSKIILASCKDFSHRIYIGGGVYGEITLRFQDEKYGTLPWTFPDYKKKDYWEFFYEVRKLYMKQFRSQRKGPNPSIESSDHE